MKYLKSSDVENDIHRNYEERDGEKKKKIFNYLLKLPKSSPVFLSVILRLSTVSPYVFVSVSRNGGQVSFNV